MKIAFYPMKFEACSYYRCEQPAEFMKKKGFVAEILKEISIENIKNHDVHVFQRVDDEVMIRIFDKIHRKGKKIVYETDDLLHRIPKEHENYMNARKKAVVLKLMKTADGISTSTPEIKEFYERINDNTEVFLNQIDMKRIKAMKKENDNVVVGWAGTQTHKEDLMMIKKEVEKAIKGEELRIIGYGGEIFNVRNKKEVKWVKFNAYFEEISHFDINLAPLKKNPFNQAKSALKVLEPGALGIPSIASRINPFERVINRENGILAEDWREDLLRLIENRALRERIGANMREYIKEKRNPEKDVERRVRFYEEM